MFPLPQGVRRGGVSVQTEEQTGERPAEIHRPPRTHHIGQTEQIQGPEEVPIFNINTITPCAQIL